ncbi:hypothetical protein IEN85_06350 [Pelagicoccus sp. NFK12]|uniref:Uncharacterized protein n=1 Tax=Pelagicoccus enzymogenes TaxID=2773457 RepID=A0A927F6G7_9BACT|nr:hypothetical protein [Pelagicoccus enzymogenes]MBD5779107.1 hypothetical protein [Pelagicoccus enzymogenes]
MKLVGIMLIGALGLAPGCLEAERLWESSLFDGAAALRVEVEGESAAEQTAIVLANLPGGRSSGSRSSRSRERLLEDGFRIVRIDYERREEAVYPAICQDIAKLRSDLLKGSFLSELNLNQARIFVLPEGYAVASSVPYFEAEERTLYLDIAYPLELVEGAKVPALLEFSCDNRDRKGNYSLVACRDTLLEGMAFAGYATAMADHPVAAPYKGLDPMPDCGYKVKAAVRTLRATGNGLGLSGELGVLGFSRGSGMALLLAASQNSGEFEGVGPNREVDSSVQAAVVLSGRFSYLDLLDDDHMLPRYERAWGKREDFESVWRKQGALDYLDRPTIPLFLSINSGEGPDAQHQMKLLRARLSQLGSEFTYLEDGDGKGHKVPIDGALLEAMGTYLKGRLQ